MTAATSGRRSVRALGQSGFRLQLGDCVVLLDPYLSDSVATLEGPEFSRLRPPPVEPASIRDASLVLISHVHQDHCDPETLLPIARSSPGCRFVGPAPVLRTLSRLGLEATRLVPAVERGQVLGPDVLVTAVPAAHKLIEREADGSLRCVGYLIEHAGRRYYHAGDTCVHELVLQALTSVGHIDVAFLPVNECNFFRDRRGIVGNMSLRDAFRMADELGVSTVVPMHYDMFALNSVYREEIEIVYAHMRPAFRLVMDADTL